MPRKPNLPNLREHDARRILAKCRRHGCRKAATVVGGLVHSQEKARARTEGLRSLPPVLRGSNLVASSLNTCAI